MGGNNIITMALPGTSLVAIIFCGVLYLGYLFIKYNAQILRLLGKGITKLRNFIDNIVGVRVKRVNKNLMRSAYLNKGTITYKMYSFLENIIITMELSRDGVTVAGLLFFLMGISLIITVIGASLMGMSFILALFLFAVIFVLLLIVFKFVSITKMEKREAVIMDAVDLLVSDVKDGVYNAIVRYRDSFNPLIRPYFEDFIDDIQNKGYGFKQAMLQLNDQLGRTFSDFAHKAIMFEEKADDSLEDIFSSVVEVNRETRTIRYDTGKLFNQMQMQFGISALIIIIYAVYQCLTDSFTQNFLANNDLGKALIIIDILIIACVLAYITSLRTRDL